MSTKNLSLLLREGAYAVVHGDLHGLYAAVAEVAAQEDPTGMCQAVAASPGLILAASYAHGAGDLKPDVALRRARKVSSWFSDRVAEPPSGEIPSRALLMAMTVPLKDFRRFLPSLIRGAFGEYLKYRMALAIGHVLLTDAEWEKEYKKLLSTNSHGFGGYIRSTNLADQKPAKDPAVAIINAWFSDDRELARVFHTESRPSIGSSLSGGCGAGLQGSGPCRVGQVIGNQEC